MFPDAKDIPEDVADAYAAGQVLAAAVTAVGKIDQDAISAWLHANTVTTILGPLSWDAKGIPQGEFMIAQWQKGKTEIVLPAAVATAPAIMGWKPGTPVPAQ
jgi:branched-chain amino acid transport system substrate-binding protein